MNPDFGKKPRNGKSQGFSISSSWDIGPRTPMWDQLWARSLGDVLPLTNPEPTEEDACRNQYVDRLEQPEELGDEA